MCFSAGASFGAGAVILATGAVCATKSTTVPQKVLSTIPFVFAAQQFCEGVLWLSSSHPALLPFTKVVIYTFLICAEVVWPIMMPISAMLLEKRKNVKIILKAFLALAVLVSAILLYFLIFYPVQATISCSHILYDVSYPIHIKYFGLFYVIASVLPPIISSMKRMRLLGFVLVASYVVTIIFYQDYLISVWCFFASIISFIVLSMVIKLNRDINAAPAGLGD